MRRKFFNLAMIVRSIGVHTDILLTNHLATIY